MSGRAFWIMRCCGVVGIALVHLLIYMMLGLSVMACFGSHCDLGTGSEDLDRQLRMDREMNLTIREIMSWPILRTYKSVRDLIGVRLPQATDDFSTAAFLLNGLVWGIGIWVLLERVVLRRNSA
jgi:hypothetical protein